MKTEQKLKDERPTSNAQRPTSNGKAAELRMVEYGKIVVSKTNPRKDFNKEALEELAGSIREHGIKQPIIVRPMKSEGPNPKSESERYEIIAGERRYRAAGMVKLATVPCMVEVMDDKTALEIQAIENLQREDLNPIEEALGYKQLQDAGYSIEQLILKTGKSRSRVFERLRLIKLNDYIQKAVLEGKLDLSRASLIGQVADPKAQAELKQKAVNYGWSHRDIKDHIEREYQKNLVGAVFDPKVDLLTPGVKACTTCPKRSGNILTFEGSPNVCTDLKCFVAKCKAGMEIKIKEAEAKGQKVLRGGWEKTHVNLGERSYELGWNEKERRYRTWGEALKKAKYTPLLAVNENELVKILPKAEAKKLAKIKEQSNGRSPAEDKKQKEQREIRIEAEKRYIAKLGPALIKGCATEKGLREGLALLMELIEGTSMEWAEVAKLWSLPDEKKATVPELLAGAIGMNGVDYDGGLGYSWPDEGVFGLKIKTFEEEVKKEREAAAKEKGKGERPTSNVQRPTSNGGKKGEGLATGAKGAKAGKAVAK